jgi:hypothetical protein
MPNLINWELVKQPYNWLVVGIMCIFALVFLGLVFPQDKTG